MIDHEHSVFGKLPIVKPFKDVDWQDLQKLAKDDGHAALAPTNVVWKDNQIVGCVSIAAIPLIIPWMHTKLTTPRDSVNVMTVVEGLLRNGGATRWAMPCVASSPYFKFMESFGYSNCGLTTLFIKVE